MGLHLERESAPARRLADRFDQSVRSCTSLGDLDRLMGDVTKELGFAHFALLHHVTLCGGAGAIRLDNYPADWAAELAQTGWAVQDPVHGACRRASSGFSWSELPRLILLNRTQKIILERSRRHGIGDGFTVPVNVPGEPAGSCSFAVRKGQELPNERLACAELIAIHAFKAARSLNGLPVLSVPHLSRREIQCLRLLAAGKTDWEMAVILGISVETARQYVKRARAAYDVVTRSQLLLLALRDDWVSFEDARTPRI